MSSNRRQQRIRLIIVLVAGRWGLSRLSISLRI
jgi:hypothetical protein